MTRLWPQGEEIEVVQARGAPATFTWRGQTHRVAELAQQWHVDLDWWRGRAWRSYFKLSTESGLLVVIYQDLATGVWYLQRLYD